VIENVAAVDVSTGFHFDAGANSMLIQIADPAGWFPTPKHQFKEIHKFEFLDIENNDPYVDEFGITDSQAREIVRLLQHALDNRMNIVVHCMMGICRSGAVVEVGTIMGFQDVGNFRNPNLRVKHKMMKILGWTYDPDEQPMIYADIKYF